MGGANACPLNTQPLIRSRLQHRVFGRQPRAAHLKVAKGVLRYMAGMASYGLVRAAACLPPVQSFFFCGKVYR